MQSIKVVVVGDALVGKTSLVATMTKQPPQPHAGDTSSMIFDAAGKPINITFHEVLAGEDNARLRPLLYPQTDVFLLCFAVDSRKSFENVTDVWHTEIRHHCPNVPVLLVGTKGDIKENSIETHEGNEKAKEIGAMKYFAVSSQNKEGIFEDFALLDNIPGSVCSYLHHKSKAMEQQKAKNCSVQ